MHFFLRKRVLFNSDRTPQLFSLLQFRLAGYLQLYLRWKCDKGFLSYIFDSLIITHFNAVTLPIIEPAQASGKTAHFVLLARNADLILIQAKAYISWFSPNFLQTLF